MDEFTKIVPNALYMQVTPDDGLWKVRKQSGKFEKIPPPTPTWNQNIYRETWKDSYKII